MNPEAAPLATLKIKRLIRFPVARVFAAWTTPAEVVQWIGPGSWLVASAKIDLRPGGEYCIQTVNSGRHVEVRGVYREVKVPWRLVYTWSTHGALVDSGQTLVTVDFVETNGGTEIQLTQEKFSDAGVRERHHHGWESCLDNLAKLLVTGTGN